VLTDEEIKKVWGAFDKMSYPFGPLFKLLLLTGQREGEVACMAWSNVDLEAKTWTIPASKTKTDSETIVPLSSMAIDIIGSLPHSAMSDLPFRSKVSPSRPVSGFGRATGKARELSGIDDWRIHDLRRTCRTGLAAVGTSPHVAELILNHKLSGILAVYDLHKYESEKRVALDAWADRLKEINS
jgi:integrase